MADTLTVRMALDARNYITGASKAAKATDNIADATKAGAVQQQAMSRSTLGSVASFAKLAVGTVAVAKGLQFAKDSVKSFSNLEESINAVNVQFGEGADAILRFGETAATEVGLANSEFNQLSVVTGALFTNFIEDEEEAAQATIKLTERAADLASVFNTDVNEALIALQASLRGEQEPIRRFGVSMDDLAVKAKAVELGLADSTAEVTQQAKQMARLEIIYEQTAKVQGDFANTSDSVANRQKILAARTEDLKASIGEALVPVTETVLSLFEKWLPTLEKVAKGFPEFVLRLQIAGSEIKEAAQGIADSADVALGPWINFGEAFSIGAEQRFQAIGNAALDVRAQLSDGIPTLEAYVAGLQQAVDTGELSSLALSDFQQSLSLTDAEMVETIDAFIALGEAAGLTADDIELLGALQLAYARGAGQAATAANKAGDAIAGLGVDILSESEALREEAMGYAAAISERSKFLAKNEPVISSYQRQASAIRDVARAQAEAASPILALLAAQERVRAAQLALTEAQQDSEVSTDDLRAAQVDLVAAQGDLEVAAANATENINDGTSAFSDLASQAGLTDDEIRDILESLDALPTEVPIHIRFTVTGLPDNVDIPGGTRPAPPVPMLHAGGTLDAGQLAIVGEKGPEFFRPRTAGTVIPMGTETGNSSSNTVQVFVDGGSGDVADQVALGLMTTGITEEIEWAGTSTIR